MHSGLNKDLCFHIPTVAPSGPPMNMKTTSRSTSSLSFTWDPPEKTKQNGVIINYTVCVSYSEDGRCFQTFISSKREWLVRNLNASTKYYVRALASTKVGHGSYGESKEFFSKYIIFLPQKGCHYWNEYSPE